MTQRPRSEARVLVADDDPSIRQLVCTIMAREGLDADCVADGEEAIARLEEREYAVILLDLMMPRVDGFGVIRYLKDHPPATKPVILVISAYADKSFKDVDPAVVAGVIRKPFEVGDLGSLVRYCVHGYDHATRRHLMAVPDVAPDLEAAAG
ncbi:MAG TPA: response regulator [Thermoanaerobaculia bacterium]|jgi:two-component system response regulator PilR (NtrC family)